MRSHEHELDKMTDDSGNAGCLVLACMSMLLLLSLCVIVVLLVVLILRGLV